MKIISEKGYRNDGMKLKGLLSLFFLIMVFLSSCNSKSPENTLFKILTSEETGLHFTNKLTSTSQFNMFKYMYFYNGAGVGAGDFNNDGLTDIFFSSNQGDNKLFINQGKLKFKDVTVEANIPEDGGWSTGVSVIDINNDGLLDIYVCRVGKYEILNSKNQLLICKGISKDGVPQYKDEAQRYGLDFSGFSTHAAFIDYDLDGDLDVFLLNHSIHQNGTFGPRNSFLGTYHKLSGDMIFRNDGNVFTEVTKQTGINSSAISYGLGVAVADINLDGYPDLYVGNDFHENDYIYINQQDGTFKEEATDRLMHTSQFSMGVDVADINNDGYPEIISVDMLPSDPGILKRSLGEDEYNIFNLKINYGYSYQYTRNNLQLNRRNGMFSEVGLYSGVAATDWSWAPLWMDFDNDGKKDLFISNGIPKRLNDIDYVNYVSNEEIQQKISLNKVDESDMALIDKFPQIKLPNKFYKNSGNLSFEDIAPEIEGNEPTYSNGAVYADFDNDGDLDIVVNNIDVPALLYENKSNDKKDQSYLRVHLKGPANNINAIGSKIIVFAGEEIRTCDKHPVKGFMSSMETPLHIGLDKTKVDSIFLIWPDNTYQLINNGETTEMTIKYQQGLPKFDYSSMTSHFENPTLPLIDITKKAGLEYKHQENTFIEFDREPLIPHMISQEGPALAIGDINNDGLDDIFIGSSKRFKSSVFTQQPSGSFEKIAQAALDVDSMYEDVGACFVDVNNDNNVDLVVASGGNEYYGKDKHLLPRVYLNDGKDGFLRLSDAFQNIYLTASCVVPYDFNEDGFIDLFIGGRAVPWEYGQVPQSYLLLNDGKGKFTDVTEKYSKELGNAGFVTNAIWFDIDKDGDQDLILSLEWGSITAFINNKGSFTKKVLNHNRGWWNFTLPVDIDGDGDIDLIAGNKGLNSRLQASKEEPVKMYYYDFDNNGKKEQILTYYLQNREIPFANKDELQKQIPFLKKQYLYAENFSKASLNNMFTSEKLKQADILYADYFANAVLINDGNLNFSVRALPWQAQLTPYKDAVVINANNDSLPDILIGGNFYENNIQMGRYDADYGTILINRGNGNFSCESINGLKIKGQVRHIKKIRLADREAYVLVRNNDSAMVITTPLLQKQKK